MRINFKLKYFELEIEKYKKAFNEAMQQHMRQCARAFVRAAVPLVPIDTGMARGSYLNIGRFLRVNIPLSGRSNRRERSRRNKDGTVRTWTEANRWYYPPNGGARIPKTPESGADLTTFTFTNDFGKLGFTINSKVYHYTIQDEDAGRSPTSPWRSMQAGREAFREEMKKIKKKIPRLQHYMLETTISYGPGANGLTETRGRLRIRTVDRGR